MMGIYTVVGVETDRNRLERRKRLQDPVAPVLVGLMFVNHVQLYCATVVRNWNTSPDEEIIKNLRSLLDILCTSVHKVETSSHLSSYVKSTAT